MLSKPELVDRINQITGWNVKLKRMQIITDTSDWMRISRGDVIRVGGQDFAIRGNMREPRFGIDDQPKYWVFSAVEVDTGEEKIIKTEFDEEFYAHISIFKIRCYRSPQKEGEVLRSIRDDMRFMQGEFYYDEADNNVRVIDYIYGRNFFKIIPEIDKSHLEYFREDLGTILWKLRESFEGIKLLHDRGFCHGDIRNDHILEDSETGRLRWIDFDLKQDVQDFDLWSLGNILSYAVGKGIQTFETIMKSDAISNKLKNSLQEEDGSAFYNYRLMNHQKVFPYIPDRLGRILRHFTIKPIAYYGGVTDFLSEYCEMLDTEFPNKRPAL